jgi:hypothetical protein
LFLALSFVIHSSEIIMRAQPIKKTQALIIFFLMALPLSGLIAQIQSDLRRYLYPPFAQPNWTEKVRPKKNFFTAGQQSNPDWHMAVGTLLGRYRQG